MQKLKRLWPAILRWLIALVLLILIWINVDGHEILNNLRQFDPRYAGLMLLLNGLVMLLMAARWKIIAQTTGMKAPFSRYLSGVWLGAFSAQAGPPILFSEVARYITLQDVGDKWQRISSQLVDRLSGQIVLVLMIFLLMPWYLGLLPETIGSKMQAAALLILCTAGLLYYGLHFYRKFTSTGKQRLRLESLNPRLGLTHYTLSLLIQGALILCFTLAAFGLGRCQTSVTFMLLVPAVLFILSILPIAISDWGTRETAAVLILTQSGLSAEDAVATSIIYGAVYSFTALLGGVLLFKK